MNPYKQAVLTICTPAEQVPLEEPPMPEVETGVVIICPQCGGTDPVVQMVDNASVAKCPQCQHEFNPMTESRARQAVIFLSERRRRQRRARRTARQALTPDQSLSAKHEAYRLLGV